MFEVDSLICQEWSPFKLWYTVKYSKVKNSLCHVTLMDFWVGEDYLEFVQSSKQTGDAELMLIIDKIISLFSQQ